MAGKASITENQGRLVLERSLRDGCGGGFYLVWLALWTWGSATIGADVLANPHLQTVLALLAMTIGWAFGLVVCAICWVGRERLCIDAEAVTWEITAVFRVWHRLIPRQDIELVALLPFDPTRNEKYWTAQMLTIAGGGRTIRFGKGLSDAELQTLLSRVRAQIQGCQPVEPGCILPTAPSTPPAPAPSEESCRQTVSASGREAAWVLVPVLSVLGFLMLRGGVSALRWATLPGIAIGLVFAGVGLLFSVASVAIVGGMLLDFWDWLKRQR